MIERDNITTYISDWQIFNAVKIAFMFNKILNTLSYTWNSISIKIYKRGMVANIAFFVKQ